MNENVFWGNPFVSRLLGVDHEVSFLSSVTVFDLLSTQQKKKVLSVMHSREFCDGEIIFRKGDPGVGMYVIREGGIDIFNETADLSKVKLASLVTGNFFGEIALLNDSFRSATAVSSGSSSLLCLFRHDLLEIMDSDPSLGVKLIYRLAQIVSERLRLSNVLPGDQS